MEIEVSLSGEHPDSRIYQDVSSVGLLRGEYIFRRAGKYLCAPDGKQLMIDYIENVLRTFPDKDVWYRFIDAPANEINMLEGYDEYVLEEFPTIGLRGMRRAMALEETFRTEFEVITALAQKHKNLHIIFPYVCEMQEIEFGMDYVKHYGFTNKVSCMMETPAAFWHAKEIEQLGIEHFLVGMNDLSSLVIGASRGSGYDRHDHPVLKEMLKSLRHHLPNSRLAVAGYMKPQFMDTAHETGMDAITVHYSSFPAFFGEKYSDYEDMDFMVNFKKTDNQKRLRLWAQSLLDAANDTSFMTTQGLHWRPKS
ncbi:putative PEP-binding protein [Vibrio ruber]|uniref:putative PEP-binding protein n=1 Tax=Vibrio ruber TaxID=184755 RepID=UPI002892F0C1|nr:putative PEP-binding protein [Vibrio ruber]WNJ97292.1 putative PEP-binding protein [Vibrio ruber]